MVLDAARLELRLTDHVEQTVNPSYRDLHEVARTASGGVPDVVDVVLGRTGEQAGNDHRLLAGECTVERLVERAELAVVDRAFGTGQPAPQSFGHRQKQVDQVLTGSEPALLDGLEQVLGAVGHVDQ